MREITLDTIEGKDLLKLDPFIGLVPLPCRKITARIPHQSGLSACQLLPGRSHIAPHSGAVAPKGRQFRFQQSAKRKLEYPARKMGADYREWWIFVHKIVDFCFHFGYSLFKSHRYDITKKGGGSREPLPFLRQSRSQILFSTSLLSNPFRKRSRCQKQRDLPFYSWERIASI